MNRQAIIAEALGSGLLFATVIGSGIMAERLAGVRIPMMPPVYSEMIAPTVPG